MNNLAVFILTHNRPDNVITYKSLKKCGYSGKIILIIDDEDPQKEKYFENYQDIEIFSKSKIAETFDEADNFQDRRAIVYARNACFEIAKKRGYKYFVQMDDDYTGFEYRIYNQSNTKPKQIKNIDSVFQALLSFYKSTNFATIAMAQGGDFIGGKRNRMAKRPSLYRKAMNSFFCSVERPFKFSGRINEDVNTYTAEQSRGLLMGTIPFVALVQKQTQKNAGGMTDIYQANGTYVKSFYTVIFSPSCCTIRPMGDKHKRLHHRIDWERCAPKIIREKNKK
jgi:hypothetical protein